MNARRKIKFVMFLIISVLAILSVPLLLAQEVTPSPDDLEEVQRAVLYQIVDEGVTPGDFELVSSLLADDYVIHSPLGDLDAEGLNAFLGALRTSLTDFEMVRDQVIVEGEFAATRSTITGTFDVEFPSPMGVLPPNNQPITIVIVNMFRFDDEGLIAEEWAQFDALGFFTQLGAFPSS